MPLLVLLFVLTNYSDIQIKKTKVLRCKTDKTKCIIRCPKCEIKCRCHSKLYKSPENLWRHLYQVHIIDKNDYPSVELVIQVLEKISNCLKNKIPLTSISLAVKSKMIVK